MKYIIPAELLQAVLNYLTGQPYREVADLLSQLATEVNRQNAQIAEPPPQ